MSYCRWSTDEFRCDLYIYANVNGYWTIHVAGRTRDGEDITLPHAGATFDLPSPRECADKVDELVALGFNCPDYVAEDLRAEQAHMDAPDG